MIWAGDVQITDVEVGRPGRKTDRVDQAPAHPLTDGRETWSKIKRWTSGIKRILFQLGLLNFVLFKSIPTWDMRCTIEQCRTPCPARRPPQTRARATWCTCLWSSAASPPTCGSRWSRLGHVTTCGTCCRQQPTTWWRMKFLESFHWIL